MPCYLIALPPNPDFLSFASSLLPQGNNKLLHAMEMLPPELQLVIAKKIAASSTRELLTFWASAKLHRRLSKNLVVLRAVSKYCLGLLLLTSPNAGQRKFMQQLTLNGHALYFVVKVAQMLDQPHPDLPRIQYVLSSAQLAGSDEAKYFLIMLKVLASEGFVRDRVLSLFHDLFTRQRLAHRRSIISADGILFDWGQLELRLMPLGLDYKFTCLSNGACAMSNMIRNSHFPSPCADEDYDIINIYLPCRLDTELVWFLGHFRFFGLDFLL
ncbi:hypothetical protein MtrunA17_Chr3g0111911 [Medicago truncatula]|uniref:Uncharacterized protein n=1 Tax=Medicago truncatula TaxID=3880 RepID=A0A396IR85_MEDTR|nr:hypothetical protein MtrunA17_Chr3g0111911 [Medicago truncatula]